MEEIIKIDRFQLVFRSDELLVATGLGVHLGMQTGCRQQEQCGSQARKTLPQPSSEAEQRGIMRIIYGGRQQEFARLCYA